MRDWMDRLAAAGVGLIVGGAAAWALTTHLHAEATRKAEARALAAQDLVVAERISARDARAARRTMARESEHLREQLRRLRETTGAEPEVVERVRWRTREVEVPVADACPPLPPQGGDGGPDLPSPPAFSLEVRGLEARVVTDAGNRVALGEVEVWRTEPPPDTLLARLPWEAELTQLESTEVGPPPGWELGPAAGLVDGEWALGAAAVGPPVSVWRVRARPMGMALAGGGEWSVAAGVTISLD
jgi:hypothetical protein